MFHNNPAPFNVNEYCSWILSQGSPHNCTITIGVKGELDADTEDGSLPQLSTAGLVALNQNWANLTVSKPGAASIIGVLYQVTHVYFWWL